MRPIEISFVSLLVSVISVPILASAHEGGSWIVDVNERGFSPSTLTIAQGDTVVFRNTGTAAHWPASDLHPTHGVYPAFDPKKAILPNDFWSFRFTKVGTWRMHDHLAAKFTGAITVESDPDFVDAETVTTETPTFDERFSENFGRLLLFLFPSQRTESLKHMDVRKIIADEKNLKRWAKLVGPTALLDNLLIVTNGGALEDCHTEAHTLGHVAYEIDGDKAFAEGNSACHSGFYHGAMEVMLQERGTEDLETTVKDICRSFPTNFGTFECLHGIGHGLLATLNYDLPAALALCKTLEDDFTVSSCYGGVFMENVVTGLGIGAAADHTTPWLNDDPLFPCNALDQNDAPIQRECYQMQTSWMHNLYPGDYGRIADECEKAGILGIDFCFVSYGRDAAGMTLRDPVKIIEKCSLIQDVHHRERCLYGGLGVIVDFWGERLRDQATALCKLLTGNEKDLCYDTLIGRLPDLFPDHAIIGEICANVDEAYREKCFSKI